MITIVVLSALDGHLGQLNGPFTLAVQALELWFGEKARSAAPTRYRPLCAHRRRRRFLL